MSMLKRCLDYLSQNRIRYSHSIHSPAYTAREVASAERMSAHGLAKTVVYYADTGYGMLVLSADSIIDFEEVLRLLGLMRIRLATEVELAELFPDCEVGAMPPLGPLFDLPVVVDESLTANEFIAFNAGTHRDVIHISTGDFRKLVKPLIGSFAVTEKVAVG